MDETKSPLAQLKWHQAVALIIVFATCVFSKVMSNDFRAEVFGELSVLKLFLVGCVGGAVAGTMAAWPLYWLRGLGMGLLGGAAQMGVWAWYITHFHRDHLLKIEHVLLGLAGLFAWLFVLKAIVALFGRPKGPESDSNLLRGF